MREQPIYNVLVYNLLHASASIFNFLQCYESKSLISSSIIFQILSVQMVIYCNFMRLADCKVMGIVTPSQTHWLHLANSETVAAILAATPVISDEERRTKTNSVSAI